MPFSVRRCGQSWLSFPLSLHSKTLQNRAVRGRALECVITYATYRSLIMNRNRTVRLVGKSGDSDR